MEEGKITYKPDGSDGYRVYTDCVSGVVEFVGYVSRYQIIKRAGATAIRWTAKAPGHPETRGHHSRDEAAKTLF